MGGFYPCDYAACGSLAGNLPLRCGQTFAMHIFVKSRHCNSLRFTDLFTLQLLDGSTFPSTTPEAADRQNKPTIR